MGQWLRSRALESFDEQVVDLPTHRLYDLVAQVAVDGLASDESVGRLGAPPVKVLPASAPISSLPFANCCVHPSVVVGVVVDADR